MPLHEAFSDPEVMRYWYAPCRCAWKTFLTHPYRSSLPHKDLAQSESWISSMIDSSQNGLTDFIICLRDPSSPDQLTPIGKIGVYSGPPSNEVGFLIAKRHWRKGLAGEAMSHTLEYLFGLKSPVSPNADDSGSKKYVETEARASSPAEQFTGLMWKQAKGEWQYPSITADTDPRNTASIGLLRKAGFVESGYLKRSMQIGGEDGKWVDSLYLRLDRDVWLSRNAGQAARGR